MPQKTNPNTKTVKVIKSHRKSEKFTAHRCVRVAMTKLLCRTLGGILETDTRETVDLRSVMVFSKQDTVLVH